MTDDERLAWIAEHVLGWQYNDWNGFGEAWSKPLIHILTWPGMGAILERVEGMPEKVRDRFNVTVEDATRYWNTDETEYIVGFHTLTPRIVADAISSPECRKLIEGET